MYIISGMEPQDASFVQVKRLRGFGSDIVYSRTPQGPFNGVLMALNSGYLGKIRG